MKFARMQQQFDRLRRNRLFEAFVILVILLSAVLVGIKSYQLDERVLAAIILLDWGITLFFLLEIAIRFLGEHRKRDFFKSGWNIFDTLIVSVSLIPIQDSELALLGRLIRIFRVLRMISIIPELRILMNSLLKALPQLGYVCLLMFIIFYIYAAIGTSFFAPVNPALWGDIARSLLTLFRVMTFEDWTDVMYETMRIYPLSWLYYISFIFLTAFAFLNMIIGIVVKVIEEEQRTVQAEQQAKTGEPQPSRRQLAQQIAELRTLIERKL
ncbi:MAG: ion transporter [Cellvibrionales bacterium]|nr:ion transporter [Cellvibrionales bacterium]